MVSGKDVAVRGRHVHLALDIRTSTVPPSAMPSLESTVFSEPLTLARKVMKFTLTPCSFEMRAKSSLDRHIMSVRRRLSPPGCSRQVSKEENTSLLTPLFDPIARGLLTAALMDFRSPISDK